MGNPLRKKIGLLPVWTLGVALALVMGLALPTLLLPAGSLWAQTEGYSYTVRPGDSWATVSARTGVSVAALQAANPDRVRETEWLLQGEQLTIPVAAGTTQREHEVQLGESWSSIAARYNIPVSLLQAANPRAIRSGMLLYRGERLIIPPPPIVADEADEAAPEAEDVAEEVADSEEIAEEIAEEEATEAESADVDEPETPDTETSDIEPTPVPAEEEATPDAAEEPTAGPDTDTDSSDTEADTEAEVATDTDAEATEEMAEETDAELDDEAEIALPACPERFLDYPQALTAAANAAPASGPENLRAFLEGCEALLDGGFVAQDLTGNEIDDIVIAYFNPSGESIFIESDLAVLNGDEEGYTLAYRARAAGDVRILTVGDINDDGLADVVWIDTTCGASTCFDTINVRSWTGELWADWTEGTITMAYAAIELAEYTGGPVPVNGEATDEAVDEDATETDTEADTDTPATAAPGTVSGQVIVLQGGIYGSVGAGPQRNRVETWASVDAAPYALIDRQFMPSECMYHVVLDANEAFLDGWEDDFARAETLYTQAVEDQSLLACWVRPNELDELRSFSMFRLALIAGYREESESAATRAEAVIEAYPDDVYEAVAAIWLREYRSLDSAAEACVVIAQFAELTPDTWEILTDYGYTNPSFESTDVCPVLTPPDPDPDVAGNDELDDNELEENDIEESAGAPEGALASFPECPDALPGYAGVLASVLENAAGDEELLEAWLTNCRALTPERGAFLLTDITGNGLDDAVIFPVVVTDLGFGPGGAQGTTLIFHAEPAPQGPVYERVANPEIYGMPEPLAIQDLNGNGQIEVAWTVTGCSTFCVTEVQMWTWNGESYLPAILPGATMANAEVSFEPIVADDLQAGKQLILYGGVSGTADGGLETPHWEEWRSIDGGPYQRVRWEYDRTIAGSQCLGLRLIEADVALQAAHAIGYGPAMELYTDALADVALGELEACSLMGMSATRELALLQGLASFRLIQTYALAGESASAAEMLDVFEAGEAESEYTTAARQWLETYNANISAGQDEAVAAQEACAEVLPIFDATPELWQVTDQYGYNHPVLAAEQICFAP